MGRLILIRHGETDKNVNNILHHSNDPELLNKVGRKQIEDLARKLRKLSISKIYSSKEKRALHSAEIISRCLKIPFEEINGIQERNLGVFSGSSWNEVKKMLKPMTMPQRYNYVPPKGESWKDFEMRLIRSIKKITKENKDKTIAVITHGGAIKALLPYLLNISREKSIKYEPANASLTIFDFDKKNFYKSD